MRDGHRFVAGSCGALPARASSPRRGTAVASGTLPLLTTAGVLTVLLSAGVQAAPITWTDPAGLCNGEAPCFTTVAAAVANAGPPPAQVFLFPGTYAESVDLGVMGSALGGGPGELAIVSVDAAGQPAPGAVVDPGAPAGPGTGPALAATAFPAPLTIDGLVLRSPDADALSLLGGSAAVLLARLDASGCVAGSGVMVSHAGGFVRLEDSLAVLNSEAGFQLTSDAGAVEIVGSVAERNEGRGFFVSAATVSVVSSRADANGQQGVFVLSTASTGTLTFTGVEATANDGIGLFVFALGPALTFAEATVDAVQAIGNHDTGLGVVAQRITATDVTARGNEDNGAGFGGQEIAVDGAVVESNGGLGLVLGPLAAGATFASTNVTANGNQHGVFVVPSETGELFASGDLSAVVATANQLMGVTVFAESVTATAITAANNGTSGVGFLVRDSVDATSVNANGNGRVGIGMDGLASPGSSLRLTDSTATGNVAGIVAGGGLVTLERCSASGSGPSLGGDFDGSGFGIAAERLEAFDNVATGNLVGWTFLDPDTLPARAFAGVEALVPTTWVPRARSLGGAPAAQRLRVLRARTEGNATASMLVSLRSQGRLTVGCSDFLANGVSGLELATDNTVDARANFWGSLSGPTHPGNPGGAGEVIRDAAAGAAGLVSYLPFLTVSAGIDDCPAVAAVEIPTVAPTGLALLFVLLASAAITLLRRTRPAG